MLTWRAQHADRTFTDMLVMEGGVGRVPLPRSMTDLRSLVDLLAEMGRQTSPEGGGLSELDHLLQCAFELAVVRPEDAELQWPASSTTSGTTSAPTPTTVGWVRNSCAPSWATGWPTWSKLTCRPSGTS